MWNTAVYDVILKAIENLVLPHKDHVAAYGEGNERRLSGHHEMKRRHQHFLLGKLQLCKLQLYVSSFSVQ